MTQIKVLNEEEFYNSVLQLLQEDYAGQGKEVPQKVLVKLRAITDDLKSSTLMQNHTTSEVMPAIEHQIANMTSKSTNVLIATTSYETSTALHISEGGLYGNYSTLYVPNKSKINTFPVGSELELEIKENESANGKIYRNVKDFKLISKSKDEFVDDFLSSDINLIETFKDVDFNESFVNLTSEKLMGLQILSVENIKELKTAVDYAKFNEAKAVEANDAKANNRTVEVVDSNDHQKPYFSSVANQMTVSFQIYMNVPVGGSPKKLTLNLTTAGRVGLHNQTLLELSKNKAFLSSSLDRQKQYLVMMVTKLKLLVDVRKVIYTAGDPNAIELKGSILMVA